MKDYSRYTPLKTIVAYTLDELNMNHDETDKAWILAFRALVLLNQSIAAEPITVRLPVSGNKTVDLPSDYLSWSKIGIMDSNGQISTLKINSAITTFKGNNPNRLNDLQPDINDNVPLLASSNSFFNYGYNGVYQTLFGIGGGLIQYGECVVDEKNNVIILSPDFKYSSVLLEYISSPEKNNDYEIQTVLQEAIIAFIKWKYKAGSREEFYGAAVEGRRSLPKKKFTLQQAAEMIRETDGQYLKA